MKCELCEHEAVATDSVPDATTPGIHYGECGYRIQPLCAVHAWEREKVATARVEWNLVSAFMEPGEKCR